MPWRSSNLQQTGIAPQMISGAHPPLQGSCQFHELHGAKKKMSKPHGLPISDPQVPAHLPQLQAFLWQFWSLKTLNFWMLENLTVVVLNLPDLEIEICRIVDSMVKFGGLDMLARSQDLTETPWDLFWTKTASCKMIVFLMAVLKCTMSKCWFLAQLLKFRIYVISILTGSPGHLILVAFSWGGLSISSSLLKRSLHRSFF